jgi:SAM-dependent methyltransferase
MRLRQMAKRVARAIPAVDNVINQRDELLREREDLLRQREELETLDQIGLRNGTDKASDRNNFLAFYCQFLEKIRHNPVRVLDIGVLKGESARMWRDYFQNGHIIGVDINVAAREHVGERLSIHIADQSNEDDLAVIAKELGPFDLIVDDGSHVWDHQILTFKRLMPCVVPGGFYILEDLDTSYGEYVANYRGANSFGISAANYLKELSDWVIANRVIVDGEPPDPDIRRIWPIVDFVAFARGTSLIRGAPENVASTYLHDRELATSAARSDLSPETRNDKVLKIGDDDWFELQFNPELALQRYGIALPRLPSDDVQLGFTAQCGRPNLQEAFSFYRYVISTCRLEQITEPRILDFGGGWGRVSRFFLRETKPHNIYIAETREWAIKCLHDAGSQFHVIHNQPRPPIEGLIGQLDLVFAYSVFSHLSQEHFHVWTDYLLTLLRPGGYLVFSTRGHFFINHLEHLHKDMSRPHEMLEEHNRRLREEMPLPEEIRRRYMNGEFQFYPIGGAGELTTDFFGETFIPRSYIERCFSTFFVDFNEEIKNVDQSVIILRKPMANCDTGSGSEGQYWLNSSNSSRR